MALPTRKNAENIDAGWFNSIKAAIEGSAVAVKTITFADSPYSILVTDGIILVDTTGGSVTLTPPLASSFEGIRTSIVKTVAANSVIVTGIRTSTTINEAFEISSDGTNYIILNDYLPNITSDLLAHVGLSSTHGASGDIVGETNTQSLTNKTIDADNNTISNLAHGSEVDDPSSGVHGAVGTIVGTSDTQTLSNKTFSDHTIFQDSIYCANEIAYGVEVNVQSGTDIIMTVPAKPILQLVDGSLVSIDDIADGTDGQAVILTNNTGVDLVINNDSSKIITGTGENLDFKDDSSIWLVFDITTTWRIVGGSGSGGGGAGLVTQNENITSATTGSFATSSTNLPILTARFWDASIGLGEWSELDPASLDLKINSTGTSVSYDTTTFTFAASDFIQISAIYPTTTNSGTEYDSGWVLVSAINGLPSAAFHRVDLPDGFTTTPAGYTLTIDDGSNVFPGDVASRLVFDDLAGVQRIAVETTGLTGTDLFRIRSSVNTLAADSQAVLHIANENIHVGKNYIINGDMGVNQDKTNASSKFKVVTLGGAAISISPGSNTYTTDRFLTGHNLTDAEVEYISINQPPGSNGYSMRATAVDSPAVGGEYLGIRQIIEDFSKFKGKTITISCKAKSNQAKARLIIYDGTGQTSSSVGTPHTGGEGWEYLTFTYTVSSVATTLVCYLDIRDDDSSFTTINNGEYIELAEFKVEPGSIATPFVPNSYADELRACQRYYELGVVHGAATMVAAGDWIFANWNFSVTKSKVPTMTYTYLANGGPSTGSPLEFTNPSTTNAMVYDFSTAAGDAWFSAELTAEAEL